MNHDEKQFEEFAKTIKFDDKPDYRHRDKLGQELLAAFAKRQWQQRQTARQIWRTIMQSRFDKLTVRRITKYAAAAAVVAVVSVSGWFISRGDKPETMTSFTLISKACAAEQSLFMGKRIIHLVTEITVYPSNQAKPGEMFDKLADANKTAAEVDELSRDIIKSWLSGWTPVMSLGPDGWARENAIDLSGSTAATSILDEAWYDPVTGRFVRVMETDNKTLFANAFDGQFVYSSQTQPDGTIRIKGEAITATFKAPENPAEFLGITAGVQQCLSDKCLRQPVHDFGEAVLEDGTPVHLYRAGFKDMWGDLNTYFEFRIRKADGIVAEIESVAKGERRMLIKRILNESVDKPGLAWNLAELSPQALAAEPNSQIAVASDAAIPNVSVRHIIERATFETYIPGTNPAWTQSRMLVDVLDAMSPPQRMFIAIYTAADNRHVVVAQSATHNKYMASMMQQLEAKGVSVDEGVIAYPNGCKLFKESGPVGWWTDLTLRMSGFTPAEDRTGYIIATPSGTILVVAVNGKLTEAERDVLVNSVIPAKEYQVK